MATTLYRSGVFADPFDAGSDMFSPRHPVAGSWRYTAEQPGEAILGCVDDSRDMPTSIRYGITPITDIFKGTSLSPVQDQVKTGTSVLVQVTQSWKVTDGAVNDPALYYLPVSAHLVLRLPTDALVTEARVALLLGELIGSMGCTIADGEAFEDAIRPLLHGVVQVYSGM